MSFPRTLGELRHSPFSEERLRVRQVKDELRDNLMTKLRAGTDLSKADWIDFLERISYRNGQILTAARFATKGGYPKGILVTQTRPQCGAG